METVIGDPKKEAILYHHLKKVRPYLDEIVDGIDRTDLKHRLQEVR
ncbi:MAG: hypothetical protein ACE5FZ_09460 [Nitrospiria bacterium]